MKKIFLMLALTSVIGSISASTYQDGKEKKECKKEFKKKCDKDSAKTCSKDGSSKKSCCKDKKGAAATTSTTPTEKK